MQYTLKLLILFITIIVFGFLNWTFFYDESSPSTPRRVVVESNSFGEAFILVKRYWINPSYKVIASREIILNNSKSVIIEGEGNDSVYIVWKKGLSTKYYTRQYLLSRNYDGIYFNLKI